MTKKELQATSSEQFKRLLKTGTCFPVNTLVILLMLTCWVFFFGYSSHVHAAYASFLWETEEDEADGCAAPSGSDKQLAWTHSEGSVEAN